MSNDKEPERGLGGFIVTDEDRAFGEASQIIPDREMTRQLLETYFVGPIPDAAVELIHKRFTEAHDSRAQWASYSRHFQSPTFWQGKAWNEEFCIDRYHMTPRDLVLMLGNMVAESDDSFPAPRLHTPAAMAGVWERVEPASPTSEPILWHLGADGSFQTNDPEFAAARLWSVKNGFGPPGPRVSLHFHTTWSEVGPLFSIELVGDEIVGERLDGWRNPPVRLRRARR